MKTETLSFELRAQLAFEADARRIPAATRAAIERAIAQRFDRLVESTLTGGYAPASAGVLTLPAPSCGCAIVHRPGCRNFFAGVT
jgi:hypothetical protein